MSDPTNILAACAVAIGEAEFERRGTPQSVQPRHFQDARLVLERLSDALWTQDVGVRADLQNGTARLLCEAVDAHGPDKLSEDE